MYCFTLSVKDLFRSIQPDLPLTLSHSLASLDTKEKTPLLSFLLPTKVIHIYIYTETPNTPKSYLHRASGISWFSLCLLYDSLSYDLES